MEENEFIEINGFRHKLLKHIGYNQEEMLRRSGEFHDRMEQRRSVRHFSDRAVPKAVIKELLLTASTAPSGAHKQPWTFCAISSPDLKKQIRTAAEKEEKESYEHRMGVNWIRDLEPLATDMHKPFLETAPWLIVVCKRIFEYDNAGDKLNNYYVNESVGIACGMLITAIHLAGLVTLTHTPSPMKFLTRILKRPDNERPFLLLPVGYPQEPAYVPDLNRKTLEEIALFFE